MISFGRYKDRPAVIVQSGALRAVLLPEDGAKMASLTAVKEEKELLAVKVGEVYKPLAYDGDYVQAECSAFDDMFPTIDPYTPNSGEHAGKTYPDHGEVCRLPYAVQIEGDSAVFTASSRLFPLVYEKRVSIAESGAIQLQYTVENGGAESFPFVWAAHIMLQGEDGMTLITPFEENAPTEMMFATKGVDQSALPKDRLIGYRMGTGAAYKFYYLNKIEEGYFAAKYPSGATLRFAYDREKLPYLGVWLNNGEFQKGYTLAPEPCTVPFDAPDKAAARGYRSEIPPKGKFELTLQISYENQEEKQ